MITSPDPSRQRDALLNNVSANDYDTLLHYLKQRVIFDGVSTPVLMAMILDMHEYVVNPGEVIVTQDSTGQRMFVVKNGRLSRFVRHNDKTVKVCAVGNGGCFGEMGIMGSRVVRPETIRAIKPSTIWVLNREDYNKYVTTSCPNPYAVFLNNVEIFKNVSISNKRLIADICGLATYVKHDTIINKGDKGDKFYIILDGVVLVKGPKDANRNVRGPGVLLNSKGLCSAPGVVVEKKRTTGYLVVTDFFGGVALLSKDLCTERETVVVESDTAVMLVVDRDRFAMLNMIKLDSVLKDGPDALITISCLDGSTIRCKGHKSDIEEMFCSSIVRDRTICSFIERAFLGEGGYGKVFKLECIENNTMYAIKQMLKKDIYKICDKVNFERVISKNLNYPFCVRQHASFSNETHVYLLFDILEGGNLRELTMSVKHKVSPVSNFRCLCGLSQSTTSVLKGMDERNARFYVGCIILAIEHMHSQGIVHRDIKPENVLIDSVCGYAKLCDFGLAKFVKGKEFTFCGTPVFLAPEIINQTGYEFAVDWWALGVMMYMMLTTTNPFLNGDENVSLLELMRRVRDASFHIKYPTYVSKNAVNLVNHLMERNPLKRLGAHGALDIKGHAWYAGFDWKLLGSKMMDPPLRSTVVHKTSPKNVKLSGYGQCRPSLEQYKHVLSDF